MDFDGDMLASRPQGRSFRNGHVGNAWDYRLWCPPGAWEAPPNVMEKGIKEKVAGPGQASHAASFWYRALDSLRILNLNLTFWVIIKSRMRKIFVRVGLIDIS